MYSNTESLLGYILNGIYILYIEVFRCCKIYGRRFDYKRSVRKEFPAIELCRMGDLSRLKNSELCDLNEALLVAVENNHKEIVEYLLEKGATELDKALNLACKKNYYDISELLVKKGANVVFGLRSSKSPNITRMLYRYDQGSEVIM